MSSRRATDGDPIRIDAALDAVTGELGAAPVSALDLVQDALARWWASTAPSVGGDLHAVEVRSFVDAELVVVAADPRVASELRYRSDDLLRCLRELPLAEPIRRVRIAVRKHR